MNWWVRPLFLFVPLIISFLTLLSLSFRLYFLRDHHGCFGLFDRLFGLIHTRIESAVPIAFLLVILLVALYFGSVAGTLGTIFACFIFMGFLFEPIRSLAVRDPNGRNSLIWMVLGGITISNLFLPPPTDKGNQIQPPKAKHFTTGA